MRVIEIIDEDFINYKKPSMFIGAISCSWKCCTEQGIDPSMCQNYQLAHQNILYFDDEFIINRYLKNPYTWSIVIGGLEPMDQFDEVFGFIQKFREYTDDDVVIYTGYNMMEIESQINQLKQFKNIIVKFGRFIPNKNKRHDPVLGIKLASPNQYAWRIS